MKARRQQFGKRALIGFPMASAPECQRCGIPSALGVQMERDHMHELGMGGIDHPYNLIVLCTRCHRAKPDFSHLRTGWEVRLAMHEWLRFARDTQLRWNSWLADRCDLVAVKARKDQWIARRWQREFDSWGIGAETWGMYSGGDPL